MPDSPAGWPSISSCVIYEDPRAAIEWLCAAFGFEVRLLVESGDGALVHTEIVYGDGVLMIAPPSSRPHLRSPRTAGGNTQALQVYVDDIEAHCARARQHGATITQEPKLSDYGDEYWTDRSYAAVDFEGHHWWFVQRLKTGDPSWGKVRNKIARHG